MKIRDLIETATAGATSSGNIATVTSPNVAYSKKTKQPKKKDGTAVNALDMKGTSIFGGPGIKRESVEEAGYFGGGSSFGSSWSGNNRRDRARDEGEPEGWFDVLAKSKDGWKVLATKRSNQAFHYAGNLARKYPDRKFAVRWPDGTINVV